MSLPVDFEEKIKRPLQANGGGYPAQISASDLMKNFIYAAGEFSENDFDVTDSKGEESPHTTRKISLKSSLKGVSHGDAPWWNTSLNDYFGGWQMAAPTAQGHFFYWDYSKGDLGAWRSIPTPLKQGEILFWNKAANNQMGGWELVTVTEPGAFLAWDKDAKGGLGGWVPVNPGADGQMIYWSVDSKKWQKVTPGADGQMIYWSGDSKKWQKVTPADNSIIFYKDKQWQPLTAPASGTHVLGAKDGTLTWIATEEC